MPHYDAVVVGAGFAGLSAAVRLAADGARVLVVEGRPHLGGRATSFRDHATGEDVDNGQHVIFGCYRETFRFLRAIGADTDVRLQATLRVTYVDKDNRTIQFQCPPLPAPLHLVAGLVEWDELGVREKLSSLRMVAPLRRAWRSAREGVGYIGPTSETVREWLIRHGQGPRVRELLWEPLALAALNQSADHAAAAPFARVLAELFGPGATDAAIGIPTRPLESFYATPARRFIESRDGAVWTQASAKVHCGQGRVTSVEARGTRVPTGVVIAAVPWHALPGLFETPPASLAATLADAAAMGSAPIVSVNLWFESPVLENPFVGLLGRTMQWVFDKGRSFDRDRSHVTLVCSGADAVVGLSNDQLIKQAVSDLQSAIVASRRVRLLHALVIRERRATFSLAPGQPARPGTETPIPGLFLAGDWIDTGLPGTIESAVVSGHRAARLAGTRLGG